MMHPGKQMAVALIISSTFVAFNIIAVMTGKADIYYSHIEQIVSHLIQQLKTCQAIKKPRIRGFFISAVSAHVMTTL